MATTAPQRNAVLPPHIVVNADLVAPRVGAAAPVLEQRAGECRPCVIDVQPLLRTGELVQGVQHVEAPGLEVQRARPYFGTYAELTLGGGEAAGPDKPRDYAVRATLQTNQGLLQVPFTLRVHPC